MCGSVQVQQTPHVLPVFLNASILKHGRLGIDEVGVDVSEGLRRVQTPKVSSKAMGADSTADTSR